MNEPPVAKYKYTLTITATNSRNASKSSCSTVFDGT